MTSLPGTKAVCSSEIMSSGTSFSQLAITLGAILYNTLQREIGVNWDSKVGFFTFGIKTKIVSLMHSAISVLSIMVSLMHSLSFDHKLSGAAEKSVQGNHPDPAPLSGSSEIGSFLPPPPYNQHSNDHSSPVLLCMAPGPALGPCSVHLRSTNYYKNLLQVPLSH